MAKRLDMLTNLALLSQVGISMLAPIIGGVYLGRWLDSRLNSQPIFLFAFIIIGIVVAFISLFKLAGGKRKS